MILEAARGILGWLLAPRRKPTVADPRGAVVYEDPATRRLRALHSDGTDSALTGAGGGATSHSSLSSLGWTASGHTGTVSRLAGFDGGGAAAYYQIGTDVQAHDAQLAALAGTTPSGGSIHYWTSATAVSVLAASTADYVLTTQGSGAAPQWKALPTLATPTQTVSSDTTLTSLPAMIEVTASCEITLCAVSAMTIGRACRVVYRGTTEATIVLVANAADKIEGSTCVALSGTDILVEVLPQVANRLVVGVLRGTATWVHASFDLTAASGSSPWSIGGSTFTDISSASSSVAASSGLQLTSAAGTAYYGSATGAVVRTPLSGLVDAWSRPLSPTDCFWLLVKEARTSGSGTTAQPGVGLGASTVNSTRLGVNMGASSGAAQLNIRISSSTGSQSDTSTSYLSAAHWLGFRWLGHLRVWCDMLLSSSPSGNPGVSGGWWPSAYKLANGITNSEALYSQMINTSLLTNVHITQIGNPDKMTITALVVLRTVTGGSGG